MPAMSGTQCRQYNHLSAVNTVGKFTQRILSDGAGDHRNAHEDCNLRDIALGALGKDRG